jgi:hypothetical protein
MIGRAWVFRCDDCGKTQMVYTETRSVAVQAAKSSGWFVVAKQCWCDDCHAARVARWREETLGGDR